MRLYISDSVGEYKDLLFFKNNVCVMCNKLYCIGKLGNSTDVLTLLGWKVGWIENYRFLVCDSYGDMFYEISY